MYMIGVTGTKGKTTTCHLIIQLLEALGKSVGMTSSVQFCVGDGERMNDTKQGMPGRFRLQKLLREMVTNGCEYAVIETTSEGMLQYRHRFIDYRMAVFTNLSPEHIERHGGFAKYRDTKVKLFEKVARKKNGVGVYNLDDENVEYFLVPNVPTKIGFLLDKIQDIRYKIQTNSKLQIQNIKLTDQGSEFDIEGQHFEVPLVGEFNVYNAAAAIAAVSALGFSLEEIANVAGSLHHVVGRSEVVKVALPPQKRGQGDNNGFTIIIDYAHEPRSLEAIYKAAKIFTKDGGKTVGLLGSQGGGRDRWKRAEMGKIAARYCDEIVLTDEDPYDEKPISIIEDIEIGITNNQETRNKQSSVINNQSPNVYKVLDRQEAIQKAISLAGPGDVVVLTGKGGEVWMCVEGGKKIPWDERKIVERVLDDL